MAQRQLTPQFMVYMEPARGYYARYSGRTRTHQFNIEPGATIGPYWMEMLRSAPETWDEPGEPEAA